MHFSLTEHELAMVEEAAARTGLARGAYAAQVVLAAAGGEDGGPLSPHREAPRELIQASGLARRIGVNLNQAVARLNATGQRSGDLLPYARECLRRVQLLDAARVRDSLVACTSPDGVTMPGATWLVTARAT